MQGSCTKWLTGVKMWKCDENGYAIPVKRMYEKAPLARDGYSLWAWWSSNREERNTCWRFKGYATEAEAVAWVEESMEGERCMS